jgi:hypothetical protein
MAHALMRQRQQTPRGPRVTTRETLDRRSSVPTGRERQRMGGTGRVMRPVGARALSPVSDRCARPNAYQRATDAWRWRRWSVGRDGPWAYTFTALALAQELGMRPLQAHCHLGLGTLDTKAGQREPARAELSAAMALCRAMDMTSWLPQAEATLAQVEGRP